MPSRLRAVSVVLAAGLCLASCAGSDLDAEVSAEVSEAMPTVITVAWDRVHGDASGAFVEFTDDAGSSRRARARIEDGRVEAVLVGLKPEQRYEYRATEVVNGEHRAGRRQQVETGPLGVKLPGLSVSDHDPARASGGYVVTSALSEPSVALIVDRDGDVVWAHQPEVDYTHLYIPRVIRSRVGGWVIYHAAIRDTDSPGGSDLEGRHALRVSLDGTRQESSPMPDAHHDLFEHADGVLVSLTHDTRTVGDLEVQGDRLVEFHPDGSERIVWSTWDRFEYDPDVPYVPSVGWTHGNAVDYRKDEGAYYVSLYALGSIVKVDRASGETVWVLGGQHSDFTLPGGGTQLFARQHQFHLLGDGIVVFDNGDPEGADSRAVEYALDEAARTVELRWEYHLDPPRYNVAMGSVERLPNGNTLITFSSLGQIDEVTPEGELVWRLRAEMGSGFGYSSWRNNLYDVVFAEPPAGEAP